MTRFYNPYKRRVKRGAAHFLLWRLGYYKDTSKSNPVPKDFVFPRNPTPLIDPSAPTLTWINHSSFLLSLSGKRFLFDPIWSERCSPFPFIGPKRLHPPPFPVEQLPPIDYVFFSHNHFDHLDHQTLISIIQLSPQLNCIVPLGLKKWFLKKYPLLKPSSIHEFGWWEVFEKQGIRLTATPAQHFSGRSLFDRDKSLWMGCVIESTDQKKRFYYVGGYRI